MKPKLILVGTERPADRERIAALRERIARESTPSADNVSFVLIVSGVSSRCAADLGKSVLFGGEYSQKQLHALLGRSLVRPASWPALLLPVRDRRSLECPLCLAGGLAHDARRALWHRRCGTACGEPSLRSTPSSLTG